MIIKQKYITEIPPDLPSKMSQIALDANFELSKIKTNQNEYRTSIGHLAKCVMEVIEFAENAANELKNDLTLYSPYISYTFKPFVIKDLDKIWHNINNIEFKIQAKNINEIIPLIERAINSAKQIHRIIEQGELFILSPEEIDTLIRVCHQIYGRTSIYTLLYKKS